MQLFSTLNVSVYVYTAKFSISCDFYNKILFSFCLASDAANKTLLYKRYPLHFIRSLYDDYNNIDVIVDLRFAPLQNLCWP